MLVKRPADERGVANFGWLDSRHSFSFGQYYDPRHMGFASLRVINDDKVAPGAGFAAHGHQDMEIVTLVTSGALEHKDSLGTGSVIHSGDVQHMSAGTGIEHSEFNHSKDEPVHFLQIWFLPKQQGVSPSYQQKHFSDSDRRGDFCLLTSPDGADGSIEINQDAKLLVRRFSESESASYQPEKGRKIWIHVVSGSLNINDVAMSQGDGLACIDEKLEFSARNETEILLFDMAELG